MNNKCAVGLTYNFRKKNTPTINNKPITNNKSLLSTIPSLSYNLFSNGVYKLNITPVKPFALLTEIDYLIPNAPCDKNTYDKDNVIYAISLINLLLLYIQNPCNKICIRGFNSDSINYYKVSRNQPPLGFSILSDSCDTMLITFRGTLTLSDVLTDVKYNYYKHNYNKQCNPETIEYSCRGFKEYYDDIKEDLLAEIEKNNCYNKLQRIVVCGHSLGASIAAVVAYNLSKIYTCVEFYGIAPTKSGNLAFSKSIAANCAYAVSVINLADCVPSLLLSYMYNSVYPHVPCNFSHVHPVAVFNNVKTNIEDCHYLEYYYEGVQSLNCLSIVENV